MRNKWRSASTWMVGGALLFGLGLAAARAFRVDLDAEPWGDDVLGI